MREQQEIRERVDYFKQKLQVLASAKAKEMLKTHDHRDGQFLEFVAKEQHLYAYTLKQYEWLLGDHSAVGHTRSQEIASLRIFLIL